MLNTCNILVRLDKGRGAAQPKHPHSAPTEGSEHDCSILASWKRLFLTLPCWYRAHPLWPHIVDATAVLLPCFGKQV